MGVAKVTLNGTTLMDVTSKTVEADKLLSGYTALDKKGDSVTGSYSPEIDSLSITPSTSAQVFDGVTVTDTQICSYGGFREGTYTINPPLTVGSVYGYLREYGTEGQSMSGNLSRKSGKFICSDVLTYVDNDTSVYGIQVSSTQIKTGDLDGDYSKITIYETTSIDGYLPVSISAVPTMTPSVDATQSGTLASTLNRSTNDRYINVPSGYNESDISYKISAVADGSASMPSRIDGAYSEAYEHPGGSDRGIYISGTGYNIKPDTTAGYISSGTYSRPTVRILISDGSVKTGNTTFTPGSTDNVIPAHTFTTGTYTIKGDSNLTSANIKKGVSIFGVNGSYEGSGGGGETTTEGGVNFIDYDGTLLHSYTATQWANQTALPANPSHTGLVAQGWNWTKAKIDSYLANYPEATVNVGQMYTTASGKTEIDINADNPDFLSPYLAICPNGTVTIDWGDGSATETITGTSYTILVFTPHTYASVGRYTITLDGPVGFYGNRAAYGALLSSTNSLNYRKTYSQYIENIRLSSAVRVENCAFAGCYALQSITIPDGVTSIGYNAFYNCYALQSITIPDGVTSIGGSAFSSCYATQYITIPDGVTSIGNSAFSSCYALQSITIPDGVTSIISNTFQTCYALQSITIPDGVTSIGNSAFSDCQTLQSISIPNSVTSIGDNAFQYCYVLQSITIPDKVTRIGAYAFNGCWALQSITIPDSVTSIGNQAFNSCYALQSITIPNGVTSIGTQMLYNCRRIKSITIPDGVTSIGGNAFAGCYALQFINIPNSVTSIGDSAFQSCDALQSITIPDGVTSIGNNAFTNCFTLQSININNWNVLFSSTSTQSFKNCYALQSITIPDGVTSIGNNAFLYCYALQSITIPDSVTSIGSSAFSSCYSLMEYHFLPTTPPTLANTNAFSNIQAGTIMYVPQGCLEAYQTASNWSTYASYMQEEPS